MIGDRQSPRYENTPLPESLVPFLVYLASDKASNISGSMFSLAGNKIQLHQEPVITKTMSKPDFAGVWTQEELAENLPKYMFYDYRSIADL